MGEEMYPGEESVGHFKDFKSSEITSVIIAIVGTLAIACIYGDVFGINEKMVTTYKYLWLAIFPR